MRVKYRIDYEAISRRSIKRDFYPERIYLTQRKMPENGNPKEIIAQLDNGHEGKVYRIASINMICEYARYSKYFIGKLVRLIRSKGIGDSTTGWYEFLHDEDRIALNQAAGWSDNKREYLLERPKLK